MYLTIEIWIALVGLRGCTPNPLVNLKPCTKQHKLVVMVIGILFLLFLLFLLHLLFHVFPPIYYSHLFTHLRSNGQESTPPLPPSPHLLPPLRDSLSSLTPTFPTHTYNHSSLHTTPFLYTPHIFLQHFILLSKF